MKKLLVVLLCILSGTIAEAQDANKVTGVVTDTANLPLTNVSVLASSRSGTLTDLQGRFTLNVSDRNAILEVSLIGYATQKVKVDHEKPMVIRLVPGQARDLGEVVVVGVQSQSKRNTIASLAGISAKDIENKPVASVDALLQGRVAGLNVQVASGQPGVAPTVVVRGNSKVSTAIGDDASVSQAQAMSGPLYVIDGIPTDPSDMDNATNSTGTNYLAGINLNDIAEVIVQRDAAATAAWGSRGANGVIYITTKRGNSKRPVFYVNTYGGITERPKLIPTLTGAAEREAKMKLVREYATTPAQIAGIPQILTDSLNPYFNNATDWQDLFYRTGKIRKVDFGMSAASDLLNYRVSGGYYNEDGIIRNFGYQLYSVRGNFGFNISPKLNSQLVIGLAKQKAQKGPKYNNSDDNTAFSGSSQPASFFLLNDFDRANYLGLASKLRNDNVNNNISASLTTNYTILPDLKYTLQASLAHNASEKDYFKPSNIDGVAAQLGDDAPYQPSYAESSRGAYQTYLVFNSLNYNKLLQTKNDNSHLFAVTLSQQYTSNVSSGDFISGYDVPSNDIRVVSGIPKNSFKDVYSYYNKDALVSLVGQLQYSYNNRYLLYGSYRGDASSRFGINSQWGYFPAVGAGWIVSDENFMKGLKENGIVEFLKFRFSYGISGKLAPDFYAPYNSYSVSGTYDGTTAIQPSFTNGLTKNDLSWGRSKQMNLGMDLNLFKSRINLSVDAYDKLNNNDIYTFGLPFYTGYTQIGFNARDLWVSNKGIDISLSTRNLSPASKLQWNSQLIFTFNKNAIAKLPNNNRTFVVDDWYGISRIYAVGQPIYELFQMRYKGVYNHNGDIPFNPITGNKITYFKGFVTVQPGFPIWEDVNGDGDVWSGEDNGDQYGDRVPSGNPNPKFTGGFTNDFSYKNFTLSITSVFTWKRTVVNTFMQQQLDAIGGNINNFARNRLPNIDDLDYWTPTKAADPNYQAGFPSLSPYSSYFYQFFPFSSMFNVDGSYFKVKFLNLNYRFADRLSQKLKVNRVDVYANATNLLILKNKHNTMPDPEAVDQLGVYTGGLYPQSKVFTIGFKVEF